MNAINNAILGMLRDVASALGEDLRKRLVFVGGSTTGLLLTDAITLNDVRSTDDIDIIVNLAGYSGWSELLEQLRLRGFTESAEDGVICRLKLGILKVDFMPDDPKILGFTNSWYAKAIETSRPYALSDDIVINLISPEIFIATKLEAYKGRGGEDLYSSKDAEDILLLVDGRPELFGEIELCDPEVREYIVDGIKMLTEHPDFDDFIDGNVRGETGRSEIVRERFLAIGGLH